MDANVELRNRDGGVKAVPCIGGDNSGYDACSDSFPPDRAGRGEAGIGDPCCS